MSFFTNIFSGKVYSKMGNSIITEDGDTFVKMGNDWIGNDGEFIQRQGNDLVNLETGTRSSFGDVFDKEWK